MVRVFGAFHPVNASADRSRDEFNLSFGFAFKAGNKISHTYFLRFFGSVVNNSVLNPDATALNIQVLWAEWIVPVHNPGSYVWR